MKIHGASLIGPGGRPLPLSSAVELDGLVYLSGQIALIDGKVAGDIAEQTGIVFDSIAGVLEGVGLTLDHVVKATVWLTDPADSAAFNSVYGARFAAPYPVRSCVVSQLVVPAARVEIEVVASRHHRRV